MRWIKKMIDCPFLMVSTCSFAIFLRGKAASRPFKLTSEMEFFLRDNTFQLFQGRTSAPLTMPVGAHVADCSGIIIFYANISVCLCVFMYVCCGLILPEIKLI